MNNLPEPTPGVDVNGNPITFKHTQTVDDRRKRYLHSYNLLLSEDGKTGVLRIIDTRNWGVGFSQQERPRGVFEVEAMVHGKLARLICTEQPPNQPRTASEVILIVRLETEEE